MLAKQLRPVPLPVRTRIKAGGLALSLKGRLR